MMPTAMPSSSSIRFAQRQRGVALIVSMLLLLVITMLAVGMYRSVGGQEKMAGNVREKQRALHAALSAQKYAEWWLAMSPTISVGVSCTTVSSALRICANPLSNPGDVPWTSNNVAVGTTYKPPGMVVPQAGGATDSNTYAQSPMLYIYYLGTPPGEEGAVYQIDAVGYGGSASSLAVVESTFEVTNGVKDLGKK